jgi:hypothetical protein
VVGYIGFYCKEKRVYDLLEDLFRGNTYVSLRFDGKVIEIFNKAKKDNIRKKNWDFISDILKDVIK